MPALIVIFVGLSLVGFFSLYRAGFCDFRAFYCSGRVVLANGDPYREHPLHECERALPTRFAPTLPAGVTLPAPYPPSTLILFAFVAHLPFELSLAAWTAGSCLALFAAIVLVGRLTSTTFYATTIVLGFPAILVPLPLGQPTLFILLALACCATSLQTKRQTFAGLAALATLLDPQIGLAVWCGVFFGVPRARFVLIVGAIAIVALNTVLFGFAREWEYIHDVLPAHAIANIADFGQFSMANLAFTAGVVPHLALVAGNIWYAVMLIVGTLAGRRLVSRLGTAAVAFVPVAFAVFGGVHTHFQQLALALPAFLLATRFARGFRRQILLVATFVACVPWLFVAGFAYLYVSVVVLAVAFARLMRAKKLVAFLGSGSLLLLILILLIILQAHPRSAPFQFVTQGNPLAEAVWGSFVRGNFVPPQAWYLAGKVPTLCAFSALLGILLVDSVADARLRRRLPSRPSAT